MISTLSGFILVLISSCLAAALPLDRDGFAGHPLDRIAARLLTGTALAVILVTWGLQLFPARVLAIPAVLVLCVMGVLSRHRNVGNLRNSAASPRPAKSGRVALQTLWIAFSVTLFLVFYLWGAIQIGRLVPQEGTGVHDEFWYIFSANWLLSNSYQTPFINDELFPLVNSAIINIGSLPRHGSESVLALIAGVFGGSLVTSFVFGSVLGSFLVVCSVALFLSEGMRDLRMSGLATALAAVSPVFLFIYGNMNLATAFGLAFAGGYCYFLNQSLRSGKVSVCAGIFLAALVSTYPELLAVVVPATAVSILLERSRQNWQHTLRGVRTATATLLLSVTFSPIGWISTYKVLLSSGGAAIAGGPMFGYVFDQTDASNFVLTLATFAQDRLSAMVGPATSVLLSILVLVAIACAPRPLQRGLAGLLLGALAVLIVFWLRAYGYGVMKSVEFLGLPLAALIAAGSIQLMLNSRETPIGRRVAHALSMRILLASAGLCIAAFWVGTAYSVHYSFTQMTRQKHLSADIEGLAGAAVQLPKGSVVYVSDDLGAHGFMVSRWAAYMLRDLPLIYAPRFHLGGYIYGMDKPFNDRLQDVTHVLQLRRRDSVADRVVFASGAYEIVSIDQPVVAVEDELPIDDNRRRIITTQATLHAASNCTAEIQLLLHGSATAAARRTTVGISINGQAETVHSVSSADVPSNISVRVSGASRHLVRIRVLPQPLDDPQSTGSAQAHVLMSPPKAVTALGCVHRNALVAQSQK